MSEKIFIRDTRTGQTALMARKMLDHPQWRDHFEEVRTDKPVNGALHTPRDSQRRLTEPATSMYDQYTIAELQSIIDSRNQAGSEILVEGAKKADFIAALDADDIATAEKGSN